MEPMIRHIEPAPLSASRHVVQCNICLLECTMRFDVPPPQYCPECGTRFDSDEVGIEYTSGVFSVCQLKGG